MIRFRHHNPGCYSVIAEYDGPDMPAIGTALLMANLWRLATPDGEMRTVVVWVPPGSGLQTHTRAYCPQCGAHVAPSSGTLERAKALEDA